MAQTFKEIIEKIDEHLKKSGKRYYSEFCIGISENARRSLFEIHHVDKDNSWWIYVTAVSVNDAEKVTTTKTAQQVERRKRRSAKYGWNLYTAGL